MGYKDIAKQRAYQREWMAKRRKDWFSVNGPCVDCGSWEKLELDHVDPAIKVSHNIWSWSKVRRDAELLKCVVRCKGCHLERTIQQQHTSVCLKGHDKEVTGYDSYGVRYGTCSECRRDRHRRDRREGRKK